MTTFQDRERAEEAKFVHDADIQFRIQARRNRLLGEWAAERMGLSHAETEAYAKAVVQADFEEAGDEDVVRKVKNDFALATINTSDTEIRKVMTELLIKAAEDIQAGR